ncbi:MAG: hypothetical protein ABL888_18395 [Pirellulaceae bacterium]
MKNPSQKTVSQIFSAIQENHNGLVMDYLSDHPEHLEMLGKGSPFYLDKTPLFYAFQCCNFDLANQLMDIGADVEFQMPVNTNCRTIVGMAIHTHDFVDYETFCRLFELSKKTWSKTRMMEPLFEALSHAATGMYKKNSAAAIISLLIENGADPDYSKRKETPRQYATRMRHEINADVLSLFGIQKPPQPFFMHPDGKHSNAYAALQDVFARIKTIKRMGNERYRFVFNDNVEHPIWFVGDSFEFPFSKLTNDILAKSRLRIPKTMISQCKEGYCRFGIQATAKHLSAFTLLIASEYLGLTKRDMDFLQFVVDRNVNNS